MKPGCFFPHLASWNPEIKSLERLIYPTKYVIPKKRLSRLAIEPKQVSLPSLVFAKHWADDHLAMHRPLLASEGPKSDPWGSWKDFTHILVDFLW